jgi:hypothetical protein
LEKVSSIIQSEVFPDNSSVNSLEYWSDEEGQYLPQMSLSPLPGEPTFRKTTQTVKEPKQYEEKEYLRNLKTSDYVEVLKNINVKSKFRDTLSPSSMLVSLNLGPLLGCLSQVWSILG